VIQKILKSQEMVIQSDPLFKGCVYKQLNFSELWFCGDPTDPKWYTFTRGSYI